jgi:hypothetical protein
MPIVLQHQQSGQIYTCVLVNHYQLRYYGTKYWDDEDAAATQKAAFLAAEGDLDPDQWRLLTIEEAKMKIFNVRLKNDLENQLFLDGDGQLTISKR